MKKMKVEFYFILYISAIISILLLAQERDRKDQDLKSELAKLEESNKILDTIFQKTFSQISLLAPSEVTFEEGINNQFYLEMLGDIKDPEIRLLNKNGLFSNCFFRESKSRYIFRWNPGKRSESKYDLAFRISGTPTVNDSIQAQYQRIYGKVITLNQTSFEKVITLKVIREKLRPINVFLQRE